MNLNMEVAHTPHILLNILLGSIYFQSFEVCFVCRYVIFEIELRTGNGSADAMGSSGEQNMRSDVIQNKSYRQQHYICNIKPELKVSMLMCKRMDSFRA